MQPKEAHRKCCFLLIFLTDQDSETRQDNNRVLKAREISEARTQTQIFQLQGPDLPSTDTVSVVYFIT